MGAHNHEGEYYKVTSYGLGTTLLCMPVILMYCIGVVMSKSRRMVGALLIDGIVGLDFDPWGCAWLLRREFRSAFRDA
jgi:hypothetical protein